MQTIYLKTMHLTRISLQKCSQFYTAHPTFFVFLEVLVKLQAMTYVKMNGTNIVAPYKMIFYVVILLYVERKGSLLGHKLVKPGHYLENSLICMIFQSALLTVWFAAHFILCHISSGSAPFAKIKTIFRDRITS